jgi:hypothetical protein
MTRSEQYNARFERLAKITGLTFEKINGYDSLDDAAEKEGRNLKLLEEYLLSKNLI